MASVPYPSRVTWNLGRLRSRISVATAETDCRRWRASNHNRSCTSSGRMSFRPVVLLATAGRLRRALAGVLDSAEASPLPCASAWSPASSGPASGPKGIVSCGVVGRSNPAGSVPSPVLRSLAMGDDLPDQRGVSLGAGRAW